MTIDCPGSGMLPHILDAVLILQLAYDQISIAAPPIQPFECYQARRTLAHAITHLVRPDREIIPKWPRRRGKGSYSQREVQGAYECGTIKH